MSLKPERFREQLKEAVDKNDELEINLTCDDLVDYILSSETAFPARFAADILQTLRQRKFYDYMRQVADALIITGQDEPRIWRQYAQLMIDQGNISPAIQLLNQLIAQTENNSPEHAEARGLMGRAYKQLYVNTSLENRKLVAHVLKKSLIAYYTVYLSDPRTHLWHGINAVALLCLATTDGVSATGFQDPKELAREILDDVVSKDNINMWDCATAVETCYALRDRDSMDEQAIEWMRRYTGSDRADMFELSSTLRQFTEVWKMEQDNGLGKKLVELLEAELRHQKFA